MHAGQARSMVCVGEPDAWKHDVRFGEGYAETDSRNGARRCIPTLLAHSSLASMTAAKERKRNPSPATGTRSLRKRVPLVAA